MTGRRRPAPPPQALAVGPIGITLEKTPSLADRRAVGAGLTAYNRAVHGRLTQGERWLLARDAAGAVQGGAKCKLVCGWVYVDWLWVAEAHRRRGLGGQLLRAAEALAREEGCRGVHLSTYSFQAPDFYRRQGYEEFGRLEDHPPGGTRYWFARRI